MGDAATATAMPPFAAILLVSLDAERRHSEMSERPTATPDENARRDERQDADQGRL
jgi:hypothetical protein